MSCDSICDFVSSITTSNVVWWNKNVKTTLQEGVLFSQGEFALHAKFYAFTYESAL
jgi:hypothetical protein